MSREMSKSEAIANLNHIYGMVSPDIQRSLDLVFKAMEQLQCNQIAWEQGFECGKQVVFDHLNKILNDNQFPEYVEEYLIDYLKEEGSYNENI